MDNRCKQMIDYIRKAVELADGFDHSGRTCWRIQVSDHYPIAAPKKSPPSWFLDALAAQLVRQVDALPDCLEWDEFLSMSDMAGFYRWDHDGPESTYPPVVGPDRTMNTIRAIVDSGVLAK